MEQSKIETHEGSSARSDSDGQLAQSERELLQEILHALRAIRYGSVNLTVHDGRIVEIQKTERIRKTTGRKD